ncbi:MAG: leucine-rich repeat domain-containing protein [Cytophagaceae bacterium]|nr:leucine-rich repeat domain-containing protein [Cytophagaceae bacterium]MDW8455854.1 leucine-rich repeat domain-containing protein [Cytophagaceae bacterium]
MPILVFSSSFNQPDAKTYYDNALKSLNQQDYMRAISEFTNAISLKSDYADAYYYRATAKELLGKKMGFASTELCSDLATALSYGKVEAIAKLEKICINECYDLDGSFVEPDIVYCSDFSSKQLTDLPNGSEKLVYLSKLNLFNNKLTSMSDKFGNFPSMISLDLSSNKLTSVSPVIGKMQYITELNLSKNQISSLPYEIGKLRNLRMLNLRHNALTSFPPSIATLNKLETLDLALNKLTSLPVDIAGMTNLKTLILVGNEIPPKEQSKIKALLPKTTIYFE